MSQVFTIFKVSWLTQRPEEQGNRDEIVEIFYQLMLFLQQNGLVVRELITDRDDLSDEFALTSTDLTSEGLALIRAGYNKWMTKIDKGMSPTNWTLLDKALAKIRAI